MPSAKAENFQLLLEVFREGLVRGIVSKEEIIAWADAIILCEDEPDYFFIQLSLSGNINDLAEVLYRYNKQDDNPISYRVLLGLIYHKRQLTDNIQNTEDTARLVGSLASWDVLTSFENNSLFEFEDHYIYHSFDQLYAELNSFLTIYKAFTLENYDQWDEINKHVLELLKEEELRVEIVNAAFRKEWAKKEKKRKLKRHVKQGTKLLFGIACVVLAIFVLAQDQNSLWLYYPLSAFIAIRWFYRWRMRRNKL